MQYNFRETEKKWQSRWEEKKVYRAEIAPGKPKYYILDMFPYPSGEGLHVGHPLGYVASDIYARYKRLKGFNVLHPMGFDAFGLPAEQYAIETGRHPADTTERNIKRYKEQLYRIGLGYDWSREVRTCDPGYYKWTQWIFLQMFASWYNRNTDKAEPVETLITVFEKEGNLRVQAACAKGTPRFNAGEWRSMGEAEKQKLLLRYRLAYIDYADVNWCPALGTVLANDEVKDGFSERGGHPVIRKPMRQWFLRITAYAERLLNGLNEIDWPDSTREMQRNWIGRSEGALIRFGITGGEEQVTVFTTRPDTIFGATFLVLAPEHDLAELICKPERKNQVKKYIRDARSRSERERIAETKLISGEFTGRSAINPFTEEEIPIWISDYVLAGYGAGAIMAVPGHDARDHAFARHFNLPVIQVVDGGTDVQKQAYEERRGKMVNSGFISGMEVNDAIEAVILRAEEGGTGRRQVNYRLRDAVFSRQRYWGEPFPVYYTDDVPVALAEASLPLVLPSVESYQPTGTGESPLARAQNWKTSEGHSLETDTMPGFAGSNWYFLRYTDPHNRECFAGKDALAYWGNVDFYLGGAEHATGHLLYSRFCNHFLYDRSYVGHREPFRKLINQGMIQGISQKILKLIPQGDAGNVPFYYRDSRGTVRTGQANMDDGMQLFVSTDAIELYPHDAEFSEINVDISLAEGGQLDIAGFTSRRSEFAQAVFICSQGYWHNGRTYEAENASFRTRAEVEKMSKSKHNVVNPDHIIDRYGADTFRMYEMFLGPIEQHKPWDTNGIEGVYRFLNKFWRMFFNDKEAFTVSGTPPDMKELKILHKTIRKVEQDIEQLGFNTCVSSFMVCVNELSSLRCNKQAVLEPLVILLSPFAPHLCEELWELLGHKTSVLDAAFPTYDGRHVMDETFLYPVSVNGKKRAEIEFPLDMSAEDVEKEVLASEALKKWLQDKPHRKVIVVKGRIINIVI